ncbi:MAG: acyltransferase family protein [Paracoccaceae bacterium]
MSALGYRPEVDGLRAVAVLPVILFHAGFAGVPGGFVGVDIFFVISGYLITSIVQADLAAGRFSFGQFYERRARRILPALFLVTAVATVFAWMILLPSQFKEFGESIGTMALFLSNHYFQSRGGYFAEAAELRPMLHTWSLSVEEQFYLFFPPLLLLLWRWKVRRAWLVLLVIGAVSLALAEYANTVSDRFAFFALPTRAFELIGGALLAVLGLHGTALRKRPALAGAAAAAGIALLAISIFWLDQSRPFPSLWALLPVLGTMLVIACAAPATAVGRVLALRPVVFIGLISYSAYLWHQPILALTRHRMLNEPSWAVLAGLIVLTLVLAALTWRFVERPFRDRRNFSRRQILATAAVISAVIFAFGLAARETRGFPGRLAPELAQMDLLKLDRNPRYQSCRSNRHQFIAPAASCVYGNPEAPAFAILGDSHVNALAPALEARLAARGQGFHELTYGGCPVTPGYGIVAPAFADCDRYAELAYDWLEASPRIGTVIVNLRWPLYVQGVPFDNGEGGVETWVNLHIARQDSFDGLTRAGKVGEIYQDAIARLRRAGKRVVLVYAVPEIGWNVPGYLAKEIQHGIVRTTPLSVSYAGFLARNAEATAALDAIPDGPDLIRIRPADLWCDTVLPGRCVAQGADLRPLYFDGDHVSRIGADAVTAEILHEMEARGWLAPPP